MYGLQRHRNKSILSEKTFMEELNLYDDSGHLLNKTIMRGYKNFSTAREY